jgi:hypothetical protein
MQFPGFRLRRGDDAKGDARLFLLAGMLIAGWASVVATARTVTMRELASFWKLPGKQ